MITAQRYYRKIIKITAEDSPNVRLARAQIAAGLEPTGEEIVPGVLPWHLLQERRATWDIIRQAVGLDAVFYAGSQVLLYPSDWLQRAAKLAREIKARGAIAKFQRRARAVGIDPAEGGDKTSMCVVDELGVIELVSRKTPNTAEITGEAIAFGRKHQVEPENWVWDQGGGGKQHADRLRMQGYQCRTVAFGAAVSLDLKRGIRKLEERREVKEERYAYVNRRAEMYGELSLLLDPSINPQGFAIPDDPGTVYAELHRQLGPIPKLYDNAGEGRLRMLPKDKKNPDSQEQTLKQLLGCSPDEADSLVLAIWGMQNKPLVSRAGVL